MSHDSEECRPGGRRAAGRRDGSPRSGRWARTTGTADRAARRGGRRQPPAEVLRPQPGGGTPVRRPSGRRNRATPWRPWSRLRAARIVAVATAERTDTDAAEVAFLVADGEHGQGWAACCWSTSPPPCRDIGRTPVRRRGSARERRHDPGLPGRGFEVVPTERVRRRLRGDEHRGLGRARSPPPTCASPSRRPGRWLPCCTRGPSPSSACRRQAAGLGHAVLTSILEGDFQGASSSCIPRSPRSTVSPPSPDWPTSRARRPGDRRRPRRSRARGRRGRRRRRRVRGRRHLLRTRGARTGGRRDATPDGPGRPREQHPTGRPELPRRACPTTPTSASTRPSRSASRRPAAWPSPRSRAGSGSRCSTWPASSGWASTRSSRWATRRTSPATTCWPPGSTTRRSPPRRSTWSRSATRPSSPDWPVASPSASRCWRSSAAGRPAVSGRVPRTRPPQPHRPSAIDALFAQAGVIACRSAEAMGRTALLLAEQPLPAGRRVAIVSNAGGLGVLAADAADAAGPRRTRAVAGAAVPSSTGTSPGPPARATRSTSAPEHPRTTSRA